MCSASESAERVENQQSGSRRSRIGSIAGPGAALTSCWVDHYHGHSLRNMTRLPRDTSRDYSVHSGWTGVIQFGPNSGDETGAHLESRDPGAADKNRAVGGYCGPKY
ncbi:hypothetical protein MTP99_010031 [Tenebrio molitor]|jgi:hypothetical protein|nr:hypothetical protein MTP99_010031 [Tenebrio molitor]